MVSPAADVPPLQAHVTSELALLQASKGCTRVASLPHYCTSPSFVHNNTVHPSRWYGRVMPWQQELMLTAAACLLTLLSPNCARKVCSMEPGDCKICALAPPEQVENAKPPLKAPALTPAQKAGGDLPRYWAWWLSEKPAPTHALHVFLFQSMKSSHSCQGAERWGVLRGWGWPWPCMAVQLLWGSRPAALCTRCVRSSSKVSHSWALWKATSSHTAHRGLCFALVISYWASPARSADTERRH